MRPKREGNDKRNHHAEVSRDVCLNDLLGVCGTDVPIPPPFAGTAASQSLVTSHSGNASPRIPAARHVERTLASHHVLQFPCWEVGNIAVSHRRQFPLWRFPINPLNYTRERTKKSGLRNVKQCHASCDLAPHTFASQHIMPTLHDMVHSDPNPKSRNENKATATLGACEPAQPQYGISLNKGAFDQRIRQLKI